jgi:hypothetical protein
VEARGDVVGKRDLRAQADQAFANVGHALAVAEAPSAPW